MNRRRKAYLLCAGLLAGAVSAGAQVVADGSGFGKVHVNGSVYSNTLFPQEDKSIGTGTYDDWVLTNTYAEVHARSKFLDAGLRFEYLQHPLPGYERDFRGWGVPFYYLKARYGTAELTAGTFYEQFGSGLILRTYEERSLGVDNSLLGGRITWTPLKGVSLKALSGLQRAYWVHNDALVSGADLELSVNRWFKSMDESDTYLTLGASWVNKYERADEDIFVDPTHKLRLPEAVNSWDVRASFQKGGVNILAEYAQKSQDPSFDNGYIYRKGYAALLSASYSRRGMSFLVQAKRSDNMSSRSRRSANGTSSYINHLPAFTMEHTYALAALYPYATHLQGEWAYQAEASYTFKRGSAIGGRYGTTLKLNASYIRAIDQRPREGGGRGTDGYGSPFWRWGDDTYYHDLNVQISKKFSRNFNMNVMYMNQFYNKTVIEGKGGTVRSNIFVAEARYRFDKRFTLRGELQYLLTKDDQGDWMFGLLELSVAPGWMFTLSDMYNNGSTHLHYYQAYVTWAKSGHRLQAGYGRTRAGYNCAGGVCRYVPASKGLTVSYSYNF